MSEGKKEELLQRKLELLKDLKNIDDQMEALEQERQRIHDDLVEVMDELMQQ